MINQEKKSYIPTFQQREFFESDYKSMMLDNLNDLARRVKRLQDSIECYRRFRDFDDIQHVIEDMRTVRTTIDSISDANELMSYTKGFPKDRFFESGITI